MIILFVLPLMITAFIAFRLIWPLKIRIGWKIACILPVAAVCFRFHLFRLFFGRRAFFLELPDWIQLPLAWAYSTLFLLFFLLAAVEAGREAARLILYWKTRRFVSENLNRVFLKINLALIPVAAVLALIGMCRGLAYPEVREVELAFPNLPQAAENCRIAVLTDLHADRAKAAGRVRYVVDRTNGLKPDLILLLGDMVDGTVKRRSRTVLPLGELSARFGVYAVPGNHEYYSGYAGWMKFYSRLGISLLENANARLPNGIWLAGVTDAAAEKYHTVMPDLQKALHGIPAGSFIVLLYHRPAQTEFAAERGVSLQLSGHTHGGMIRGIDLLVALFNGGFASGLYDVNGMKLYVSNGSGIWSGFPVRLGRESEITLITLRRSEIPHGRKQ